jgi:SAM-dependent methyltransferase/pimeloyl-ACP methyl ester carboxylesterase
VISNLDRVSPAALHQLNRGSLKQRSEIRKLFSRLRDSGAVLRNGIDRGNDAREAKVSKIDNDVVWLKGWNVARSNGRPVYFNFDYEGTRYFFATSSVQVDAITEQDARTGAVELPSVVFVAERRDLYRRTTRDSRGEQSRVEIRVGSSDIIIGRLVDRSLYGVGLEVPAESLTDAGSDLSVRFVDSNREVVESPARLQYRKLEIDQNGWVRIGLHLGTTPPSTIEVDRRNKIVDETGVGAWRSRAELVRSSLRVLPSRAMRKIGVSRPASERVPIVEYLNESDRMICGILESVGDRHGAPAVIIPPAWGRTKETLQPLAATILATFEAAGEPVTVLRFDGTNRRGESYIDPECRSAGDEYLRFTFSQAARDIEASVDYLYSDDGTRPSTVVLATFSLAAIEGRRAVAQNAGGRIGGWVSTVGMIDLQSALRTISGGIDFGYGLLQGIEFGRHELVGVVADMDHTGLDAIRSQLGFLEEARRDFDAIRVPVTWIHGRHDAWMDLNRVRDAISHGESSRRRLIEVPTGHQLRTSREALSTFRLISEEISEMTLGRRLRGRLPDLRVVEHTRDAERRRRPKIVIDLRRFWRDYLLGRDRRLGMQLISSTQAYRDFMDAQILELKAFDGARILDLGAGAGEMPLRSVSVLRSIGNVRIDEVDFVADALARGAQRLGGIHDLGWLQVGRVVADLNLGEGLVVPLRSGSYDSVLASLLISYLAEPHNLLNEAFRILRPGGRIVISSLRRDADISNLYADGMSEFSTATARRSIGGDHVVDDFDDLARSFLNDASKILDLEEQGSFAFWDARELESLLREVGFVRVSSLRQFGDPPQAVIASGMRP